MERKRNHVLKCLFFLISNHDLFLDQRAIFKQRFSLLAQSFVSFGMNSDIICRPENFSSPEKRMFVATIMMLRKHRNKFLVSANLHLW